MGQRSKIQYEGNEKADEWGQSWYERRNHKRHLDVAIQNQVISGIDISIKAKNIGILILLTILCHCIQLSQDVINYINLWICTKGQSSSWEVSCHILQADIGCAFLLDRISMCWVKAACIIWFTLWWVPLWMGHRSDQSQESSNWHEPDLVGR